MVPVMFKKKNPYPEEKLDPDYDDGTMVENVETLAQHVVGHRIVSAEQQRIKGRYGWMGDDEVMVLTLDDGTQVRLRNTDDCCAYTALEGFLLDPNAVDHVIMGVGTTEGYSTWHIYADYGDILKLEVGWSCGNPFYYGYGFDIEVVSLDQRIAEKEAQS